MDVGGEGEGGMGGESGGGGDDEVKWRSRRSDCIYKREYGAKIKR